MKILICGDRNYTRLELIKSVLDGLHRDWFQSNFPSSLGEPFVVVEGEARGADTLARKAAEQLGLEVEPYPAKWDEHDWSGERSGIKCFHKDEGTRCPAAGPRRNKQMLDKGQPSLVLCFHDDFEGSKGTKNMATQAKKAGVPVYVISRY